VRKPPPQGLSRVKQRFAENVKTRMALEEAIERSRMKLLYQPIVCLADGTVAGFAALARWPGAPAGLGSPGRFISLAENTGLIVPLGEWILATGLAPLQRLSREAENRGRRSQPLFMSVNVSPEQIARPGDLERLVEIIEACPCPPGSLKLELTESAMLRGGDAAFDNLTRLRATGASISIDDFGTGYSSLSYLHRFPINVLKIDRSFTNALSDGPNGGRIVSAILSLSRELELEVVAEGIEHEEEARWLRERSCEYGQGYHFSRPVEFDKALALLGARYI
jgi:EAL domain-containing protein (putative c-di-GMP-specific phosphodiesterase class I)